MHSWAVALQSQGQRWSTLQPAGRGKVLPFPLMTDLEVRTPLLLTEAENMGTWAHAGARERGKCDIYSVGGHVPLDGVLHDCRREGTLWTA